MFPFKKILVPTDFSEPSLCGLKMANEMADKFGSDVIVVNVHKPIPQLPLSRMETADISFDFSAYEKTIANDAQTRLAQVSEEIMHDHIMPRLIIRMGRPADEILRVAEEESACVVITTCATEEEASHLASALIESRLAACVQISEPVQSRYRWQGKIESAKEYVLTIKSRLDLFDELRDLIESLHPYDVPEILAFRIEQGAVAYLEWLDNELRSAD